MDEHSILKFIRSSEKLPASGWQEVLSIMFFKSAVIFTFFSQFVLKEIETALIREIA